MPHFDTLQIYSCGKHCESRRNCYLTLSQTSPGFHVSAVQVFWKHCGKRRNCVTSNFSFSNSVFYPFGELSAIFIKFKYVVCKLFKFGRVYYLSFGKGLKQFLFIAQCFLPYMALLFHFQVPIVPNWKGVCLQNTSKSHSYHLKIWQSLWFYG